MLGQDAEVRVVGGQRGLGEQRVNAGAGDRVEIGASGDGRRQAGGGTMRRGKGARGCEGGMGLRGGGKCGEAKGCGVKVSSGR
jgi:hypothetical protein